MGVCVGVPFKTKGITTVHIPYYMCVQWYSDLAKCLLIFGRTAK